MHWHTLRPDEACAHWGVDPAAGLSSADAAHRLENQGRNELTGAGGISPWRIIWEQFTSTMALILAGAALLSFLLGSYRDSATILAIVCLFATLGFVQEYRAEKAMRALKQLAVPTVRVRRGGNIHEIAAVELVCGDIVLLEAGVIVPADCRMLEAFSLKIEEALLTGENEPVEKVAASLAEESAPVGDRQNMAWMGTTVSTGRGVALVVATGMGTELGRIATMLQDVKNEWTPLQKRLDRLGKVLAVLAVIIAAVVFVLGVLHGEGVRVMLMTAVSLAVAAIPEGLPAVVTITLAIGAQRMLRRKALIRKLPAVETLGSVTVVCTDKTGTLTENRMTVTSLLPAANLEGGAEQAGIDLLRLAGLLCNDAALRSEAGHEVVAGDPTEGALLLEAAAIGQFRPERELDLPRVAEVPFDSAVKRMITIHAVCPSALNLPALRIPGLKTGDHLVFAKGASDAILPVCSTNQALHVTVSRTVDSLAGRGERVLAVAFKIVPAEAKLDLEECQRNLALLGLVAIMDPLRNEAREAVARCRMAGIRPIMITGDHPLTAATIAAQAGIDSGGGVLLGRDLDRLGVAGLAARIADVSIYSRVSPEHKLLIVQALQQRGEVVSMTGDGVNDAPALKKADIGVAMGITGTDVAREASDMVLLDDNFATIVAAVEEGRTIYDNIIRFIEFSVAGNLGKILAVVALPFLGLPIPLTPLQLLWLNLLTDGLLGLGMGVERPEPDVMRRKPISPAAQIFDRRMLRHILITGGVIGMSAVLITSHYWTHHHDGTWQTVLFTSLAFAQIGQAMALRSTRYSFFAMGFFTNLLLLAMACVVIILQAGVVYLPVLQPFFRTAPLSSDTLGWVVLPGVAVFAVLELEKFICRLAGRRNADGVSE